MNILYKFGGIKLKIMLVCEGNFLGKFSIEVQKFEGFQAL